MKLIDKIKKGYKLHKKASNDFKKFKKIPKKDREIVFYAETSADWSFIGPVYQELIKRHKSVIRVTSDIKDIQKNEKGFYYIGYGSIRTIFFRTLDSQSLVLTLTDVGSSYLKKSMFDVHYFYIFHSLNSSHVAYKEHAFDNYSTIFCASNYHVKEIEMMEKIYGLKNKNIEQCGYPKLDELLIDYGKIKQKNSVDEKFRVLVAPSWGETSMTYEQLEIIIDNLLFQNYVILRLHPMMIFKDDTIAEKIETKYKNNSRFKFDQNYESNESFIQADFLISDWSGSAIEFAYTKLRPVIFIETKQKVRNKEWKNLGLSCFEKEIRNQIGINLSLENLSDVNIKLGNLKKNLIDWEKKIYEIRKNNVFNLGKSAEFAANKIINHFSN